VQKHFSDFINIFGTVSFNRLDVKMYGTRYCRRKVRLSQKTARQRRQSPNSATIALFCDSVDRALRMHMTNSHTARAH